MTACVIRMFASVLIYALLFAIPASLAAVVEARVPTPVLIEGRQAPAATPTFPSDIPSCQQCEQNYGSIDSCAQAAPVLANFTTVCVPLCEWVGSYAHS